MKRARLASAVPVPAPLPVAGFDLDNLSLTMVVALLDPVSLVSFSRTQKGVKQRVRLAVPRLSLHGCRPSTLLIDVHAARDASIVFSLVDRLARANNVDTVTLVGGSPASHLCSPRLTMRVAQINP